MTTVMKSMALFKIVPEYCRAVRFNFGKFDSVLKPGIRLRIPVYHQIIEVDMRETMADVPKQTLISKDCISFTATGSVQYRIIDAEKAVINVDNIHHNIIEKAQMEMKSVLTSMSIKDILEKQHNLSEQLQEGMTATNNRWGIVIESIQIKDIQFDQQTKQSMSVEAEATRNSAAKLINANADIETAKIYSEAAKIYSENPITLRLREFQLWQQVSKNPASSIYVIPSNLLNSISKS